MRQEEESDHGIGVRRDEGCGVDEDLEVSGAEEGTLEVPEEACDPDRDRCPADGEPYPSSGTRHDPPGEGGRIPFGGPPGHDRHRYRARDTEVEGYPLGPVSELIHRVCDIDIES